MLTQRSILTILPQLRHSEHAILGCFLTKTALGWCKTIWTDSNRQKCSSKWPPAQSTDCYRCYQTQSKKYVTAGTYLSKVVWLLDIDSVPHSGRNIILLINDHGYSCSPHSSVVRLLTQTQTCVCTIAPQSAVTSTGRDSRTWCGFL